MIITNAKGRDQKLSTEAHEAVAAFLKVNSRWLLTGEGPMEVSVQVNAPTELTPAAVELAVLFDMIPQADKLSRAKRSTQPAQQSCKCFKTLPPRNKQVFIWEDQDAHTLLCARLN